MLQTPFRTLADPETQGEGSLDPLGLAPLADRLAEWILPGMAARMWRPRFVTATAVSAIVIEPFADDIASDGATPPWLILEWYYVAAMARLNDAEGKALRRIPGIDKARQALRDRLALSADRYLKAPKVFGFHGVYKRLARHLDVVDDDLGLAEQGYRLVRVWEEEQGLPGLSDPDRDSGDGPKLRRALREAIQEAMQAGQATRQGSWVGADFFTTHLAPHQIGLQEGKFLLERLIDPAAEPRGEVYRLVRDVETRRWFSETRSERGLIARLRERMTDGLRRRVDAIEAYEGVCRPLQEALDRVCHLSTLARPALVHLPDAAQDARLSEIGAALPTAIGKAHSALAESPYLQEFDSSIGRFDGIEDAVELFQALWDHHVDVQRRKPPAGKRPWFEQTDDGGLIVRPMYRLEEALPRKEYVHPYRLTAVVSFLDDLVGAA